MKKSDEKEINEFRIFIMKIIEFLEVKQENRYKEFILALKNSIVDVEKLMIEELIDDDSEEIPENEMLELIKDCRSLIKITKATLKMEFGSEFESYLN